MLRAGLFCVKGVDRLVLMASIIMIGKRGSVENVGVSRSGDAPPKATRANGESGR